MVQLKIQYYTFQFHKVRLKNNIDKIFEAIDIHFEQSKDKMWIFAEECVKTLKEKGVSNIDNLTQEDVATLTGRNEILVMKTYNDKLYDSLCVRGIEDDNAYNYMNVLIKLHFSLLK